MKSLFEEIAHPILFVTGNSTAGKSTLARDAAKKLKVAVESGDHMRVSLYRDRVYGPTARFYESQADESEYYATTSERERWENLRRQSERLWPALSMKVLAAYRIARKPIVVEGVNFMPDLVARDFPDHPIIAIVCDDEESVRARLAEKPRWGRTPDLQMLEAREIAKEQAPRYRTLTLAAGGQVFASSNEALELCGELLRRKVAA